MSDAVCKTVSGKPAKRATFTPWDFGHEPGDDFVRERDLRRDASRVDERFDVL